MSSRTDLRAADNPDIHPAIRLSVALRNFVDLVGRGGSFLILPLICVTIFDVVARKLVWIQIFLVSKVSRLFESTLMQELEWHFHTALFVLVLGYGYIYNTHVRVDLVREKLNFRKQTWIEFLGCSMFMIPYTCVVIYFASIFAYESFMIGEISASQVGLTHRWIIKTVLTFGLVVAAIAGFSVWLQTVLVLFGPKDLRFQLMTLEWPEDVEDDDEEAEEAEAELEAIEETQRTAS